MTRYSLLVSLPTDLWWPMLIAAALPLLAYLGVRATSHRLSGALALRFALGAAVILASGFAIVIAVATLEVLHAGLADRAARYQVPVVELARALTAIPDVLRDTARVRPRLEIAVATEERAIWSVLVRNTGTPSVLAHAGALPDRDIPQVMAAAHRVPAAAPTALLRRRGKLELLVLAAVRSPDGAPVGTVILAVDTHAVTESAIRTAWLLLGWALVLLVTSVLLTRRLIQLSVSVRVAGLIARLQEVTAVSGTTTVPPHRDELLQLRSEVDRMVESNVRLQRENDAQYEIIVERMPDAVLVCLGRVIHLANPAAVQLLGATSAVTLAGTDFRARISEDPGVLDSGARRRWRLRRDDGSLRDVEISEAILPAAGAEKTEIVVRDVTSAVRAERSLARSEAVYRTLFEGAPIGIAVVDDRLEVLAANPALVRLFSRTDRHEIIGRLLPDLIGMPAAALGALRRGLSADAGAQIDVEFTSPRGPARSAAVTMQRLIGEDDGGQFELLWLDRTTQRALEAQVQHTQKLEAVGRLSSGIAHDFNNLLTVIRANASLLGSGTGRVPELDAIEEASVRGAALIRKLLIFSRKQDLTPRPWPVAVLLDELVAVLRRLLPASIELRTPNGYPDAAVMVDRVAFEQVMLNLVTNGCDAMPDGGVLEIDSRTEAATGALNSPAAGGGMAPWVRFTVRDHGTGMSAAVRTRAFEPFFTTKPAEQGTGLGLAIVYGLVTQMGGTVSLGDGDGGGTAATVLLPAGEPAPPDQPTAPDRAPGGGGSVLLVEDDESVRRSTAMQIGRLGYRVSTATQGLEALALLESGPLPDVIVSDVMMPEMGGPELVKAIRARGWTIPILLVSGYSTESLAAIAASDPSVAILGKPWSRSDLARALRARADHGTNGVS